MSSWGHQLAALATEIDQIPCEGRVEIHHPERLLRLDWSRLLRWHRHRLTPATPIKNSSLPSPPATLGELTVFDQGVPGLVERSQSSMARC